MENLTSKETDQLKNIFTQSLMNAISQFGVMLRHNVTVSSPSMKFINFGDISYLFSGSNRIIIAIYLEYSGEYEEEGERHPVAGRMLLTFKIESAYEIATILTEELKVPLDRLDEMTDSIFGELGNVFGTTFLSTISQLGGIKLVPSIPKVIKYRATSIAEFVQSKMSNPDQEILMLQTALDSDDQIVEGAFMFIPDEYAGISRILSKQL